MKHPCPRFPMAIGIGHTKGLDSYWDIKFKKTQSTRLIPPLGGKGAGFKIING